VGQVTVDTEQFERIAELVGELTALTNKPEPGDDVSVAWQRGLVAGIRATQAPVADPVPARARGHLRLIAGGAR
jgi:hypothetical protein